MEEVITGMLPADIDALMTTFQTVFLNSTFITLMCVFTILGIISTKAGSAAK